LERKYIMSGGTKGLFDVFAFISIDISPLRDTKGQWHILD
jgi:hypothetical protein